MILNRWGGDGESMRMGVSEPVKPSNHSAHKPAVSVEHTSTSFLQAGEAAGWSHLSPIS